MNQVTARQLKMLGLVLFLLGLLTGFAIMNFRNPRMGLAAHLEGVMNGTFLIVAGYLWNEMRLSSAGRNGLTITLLYGTFANWVLTVLSAVFGTSKMTPLSGAGFEGSSLQENIISAGLISVGLTMIYALAAMVYGMRGRKE